MNAPLPATRLPAVRGWRWIVEGWHLFMCKPLTWIVFTVITWLFVKSSAAHPLLMAAASVVLPVLLGGWSTAIRAAEAGKSVPVNMLFSGFRERFGDLSAIGAVSLMGNVMLWLVMFALVGDLLTEAVTRPESLSPEQAQELQSRMSVALVIMLALGVPLAMAASARISVAVMTPWPPMPTTRILVIWLSGMAGFLVTNETHRLGQIGVDDGVGRAGLDTKTTACAGGRLDGDELQLHFLARRLDRLLAARDVDGRTTDIDAIAAAGALLVDDFVGLLLLVIIDQHAGLVGDDYRHLGDLDLLTDGLEQHRQLVGIDEVDTFLLDAERLDQTREIDAWPLVAMDALARPRVALAAGHADRDRRGRRRGA